MLELLQLTTRACGLWLAATVAATSLFAESPSASSKPLLRAEPFTGKGAQFTWEGAQFVRADTKGMVYLFDAASMRVFPVLADGDLGRPIQLEGLGGARDDQVLDVAMGSGPGNWLALVVGSPYLRVFEGGKEKALPVPTFKPTAVSLPAGRPVVAVMPMTVGEPLSGIEGDPPLLMELRSSAWQSMASQTFEPPEEDAGAGCWLCAETDYALAVGPKASVWLARKNAYHLRRIDSFGRLLTEIQLGSGRVEYEQRSQEDSRRLDEAVKAMGSAGRGVPLEMLRRNKVAKPVIKALAVDRSGVLYVLVASGANDGAHLALDRLNPLSRLVERVSLDIPTYGGRQSMAAGRDGLFVVNYQGNSGRWVIPWDAVENASWEEVSGVTVTDKPGG